MNIPEIGRTRPIAEPQGITLHPALAKRDETGTDAPDDLAKLQVVLTDPSFTPDAQAIAHALLHLGVIQ